MQYCSHEAQSDVKTTNKVVSTPFVLKGNNLKIVLTYNVENNWL